MTQHVIALMVLSIGLSGSIWSQTLGSIVGEVQDASGAVAPNVKVTATNTETNVSRETITNTAGIYTFPALVPGTYTVRVEAQGFQVMQRRGIELQVQQTASIDFVLAIGQNTQTVEVSGVSALLNTEDSTVGTVIEQRRINDLPLNGRNFFSLVALSPNVTYGFTPAQQASGRLGGTRSTLTMSLSGARATWANYTLDGITNTDVDFNTYIMLPSVDALQEFKVQSGIYPAEFGREAGQINVSTKPGGNNYHGSAYEFLRNNRLDARAYDFPFKHSHRCESFAGQYTLPAESIRLHVERTGPNSEDLQREEPAVLHVELRRLQVAHHLHVDRHHDAASHARRRFLGCPNHLDGPAFSQRHSTQRPGLALPGQQGADQSLRQGFPSPHEQILPAAESARWSRSANSQLSIPGEDSRR